MAYRGEFPRRCRAGRVLRVNNDARLLSVRVHGAEADSRLRVRWSPLAYPDESETPLPRAERVSFDAVLTAIELNSGVMAHAASRRLDVAGWKLDEGILASGAVDVAGVRSETVPPLRSPVGCSKLGPLLAVCRGNLHSQLNFIDDSLQRRAVGGEQLFLEAFHWAHEDQEECQVEVFHRGQEEYQVEVFHGEEYRFEVFFGVVFISWAAEGWAQRVRGGIRALQACSG